MFAEPQISQEGSSIVLTVAPHILAMAIDSPDRLQRLSTGWIDVGACLTQGMAEPLSAPDLAEALDGGKVEYNRLCREDVLYILVRHHDETSGVRGLTDEQIVQSPFKRRYYDLEAVSDTVEKLLLEKKLQGEFGGQVWVVPEHVDELRECAKAARRRGLEAAQAALGGKSLQDVSATQEAKEYDAFLCHASEDKDAIVRPFAEAMEQQGLKPWFDKAEVRWGDSLVKKINYGLSRSKLVVVFVSPAFLGKEWPEREFNAAMSMEVNGKTVVLPLLCGVTRDKIQECYPVISDKVYREFPHYTAASKTEPSRLDSLVRELRQRIAEPG